MQSLDMERDDSDHNAPINTEAFKSEASESPGTSPSPVPDGGVRAWMTIAGAWLALFSTYGYLYSYGVYQDFYVREYLVNHSASSIAWIGSFQLTMPLLIGLVSGKLFDSGGFHPLVISGSILMIFSTFMLSLTKPLHYYQVFLSQAVGVGFALGLTFVPILAISSHWFKRRRSFATGVALSGICVGGTILPISTDCAFSQLIARIGFADAVRASGYLILGLLFLANILMRTRPIVKKGPVEPPNLKSFFVDPLTWRAGTLSSFGIYFPIFYLQLYAVQHSVDGDLAFYSLAIVNGTAVFGRILANYFADIYGPYVIQCPVTITTGASIWAILGIHDTASLVVVSIFYGLASGAWLGLSASGVASLAKGPEEVGARTGLAFALTSVGTLTSGPIQGALLGNEFDWVRPIAFSAVMMFVGGVFFGVTAFLQARRLGHWRV
ncbi:MFS general substrate transporter [Hymenopellis radicata]|nr:MFS general substrate transporter [Hymenopellis radicata]